jgi:parallel beta-helix repeat protein
MRRSSLLPVLTLLSATLHLCGCGLTCTVAPSITGQPTAQTVTAGQPALFTVAASGSAPLSFQWLKNGAPIAGATQPSYLTPATSPADSDSAFTVKVTNHLGTLTSSPAALTVNTTPPGNALFVAPNGNDSNPGTIDQPFRTIQKCATTAGTGWTCEVRAGTYRETVTPNSGITIAAYALEQVTVDGSDPVTGWTLYQGSIYKAKASLSADDTNQLFVGSTMMTEARWPNGDDLFHVNWATEEAGTDSGHIVDPKLPAVDWTGARIHLWSGTNPFGHQTGSVTASGTGQISISVPAAGACPSICPAKGGFYYLFGTLSALDTENEWFYDSSSSTLYFMAPGKVDPNTLDVRSKQRQYAFDLRGKSGVTLRDISIFASTIVTDKASSNNTLDRINAQYVSHFTNLPIDPGDPTGSNFSFLFVHQSDTGIILNGTGNTLENSTISYSAGAGVALEGTNNTVRNNLIQNIDYIGDYDSGIDLDGQSNTIQHNTINTAGRQAIHVTAVLNQDMSYNNLMNSMKLSRDGAAIYACCNQLASGTSIHHNWIHDTTSVVKGAGDSNPMAGIYIDNGSAGFNIYQNVLWHNQIDNIIINGYSNSGPNNNSVSNNTVPDGSSSGQIVIRSVTDCTALRIVNNRVAVSVGGTGNGSACAQSNNSSSAPGATEMLPTTEVGCNFDGCSSDPPPAILAGGSVTPCPVTQVVQQ